MNGIFMEYRKKKIAERDIKDKKEKIQSWQALMQKRSPKIAAHKRRRITPPSESQEKGTKTLEGKVPTAQKSPKETKQTENEETPKKR